MVIIRSEIRSQCRPPTWPDVWFKGGSRQKQGVLLVTWHFWACPPFCSHLEERFPVWSASKPRQALALFKRHPHCGTTEWLNETPVPLLSIRYQELGYPSVAFPTTETLCMCACGEGRPACHTAVHSMDASCPTHQPPGLAEGFSVTYTRGSLLVFGSNDRVLLCHIRPGPWQELENSSE